MIDIAEIKSLCRCSRLIIVSTGSQGETMSALYRMAYGSHKQVEVNTGDRILIAASAIPGNEKSINNMVNELYKQGAEVIYDRSAAIHVSGHACQEDLKLMLGLCKPKYFIPVHGEYRMLMQHAGLAREMGVNPKNILITEIGRAGRNQREFRDVRAIPCLQDACWWTALVSATLARRCCATASISLRTACWSSL